MGWRATLAVTAGVLTGCGPSVESQRESLVECSAYLAVLAFASMGDEQGVMSALEADFDEEVVPGGRLLLIAQTGAQYAGNMDPARAGSLAEAGQNLALDHNRRGDIAAARAYAANCSRVFDALAR